MRRIPHLERNSWTMRSTVDASGTACCCVMAMSTSPQSPSSWSERCCAFHEQWEARGECVWGTARTRGTKAAGLGSRFYITSRAPSISCAPTTSLILTACSIGTAPPHRHSPPGHLGTWPGHRGMLSHTHLTARRIGERERERERDNYWANAVCVLNDCFSNNGSAPVSPCHTLPHPTREPLPQLFQSVHPPGRRRSP